MLSAALLLLPLLQGGGGKVKEVEYDVLILKNSNRITGTLVGENDTEILIRVKGALLGVRKELVEKRTKVILRVREAAPTTPGPGTGTPTQPKGPETGPVGSKPLRHDLKLPDPDPEAAKKIFATLDRMAGEDEETREKSIQELSSTGVRGQIYLVRALLERPHMFEPIIKAIQAIP